MKHHLSSIRRSLWLRVACVLILTLLCAPAAMAAVSAAPVGLPIATGSNVGSAFLAAGLGGMIMLRNAASDEGGDNGGGGGAPVDPTAAIAAIEDKTLPMSQRLSVALKALQGIAPADQFAKVKTDLATANSTLQARDTEIGDLKAKLKTVEDQLAAAQGDVTTLEQSNAQLEKDLADLRTKEADVEKRADVKSKEKLASLGFPASRLPGPDSRLESKDLPQSEATLETALAECNTQKERSELLRSYRARN
jgi:hypothetical protein